MTRTPNRVYGTEMEWPINIGNENKPPVHEFDIELMEDIMKNCLPDGLLRLSVGGMMTNGGRLYQDMEFIEYATPEDNNLRSAVANEIAGERIVRKVLERAVQMKKIGSFAMNKRVLDDVGSTWGYHANFSSDGKTFSPNPTTMAPLGMHLATHSIYAGAGAIWHHGRYEGANAVYSLAQKVSKINRDYGHSSHGSLTAGPLVNLKSESHTDDGSLRIHQSSMDANISPWATWMKLGVTSIVLRLIENGYRADDLQLDYSNGTMRDLAIDVALDPTLKHSVQLAKGGGRMRAIDIQRQLHKRASDINLSDDEMEVMPEWGWALDTLDDDPEQLSGLVDWVARRSIVRRMMEKHDLPLHDRKVAAADRLYDNTDPDHGIGMLLRRKGTVRQWMPSEKAIERAMLQAPSTTRAKARSEIIRQHYSHSDSIEATWDSITVRKGLEEGDDVKLFIFDSVLQLEPTTENIGK